MTCQPRFRTKHRDGGEGWIRTSVRLRGQIYSLLPLTTRPPLHEERQAQTIQEWSGIAGAGAPHGGADLACQRARGRRVSSSARALQPYASPEVAMLERVKGIEPSS